MGILDFLGLILSVLPSFFGKAFVIVLGKEVDEGKDKKVLRNEPRFRWCGLAFFTRYHYSVAQRAAKKLAKRIRKPEEGGCPDLIVGIGRGGAIFGSMLSYRLENTPLLIVDRTYSWSPSADMREEGVIFNFDFPVRFKRNVLVVAGEYHSGRTMAYYCTHLRSIGVRRIRTCSFFVQKGNADLKVDYLGREAKGYPLMPWQDQFTIRDSISAADSMKLKRISSQHRLKRIFIVRHGETLQNKEDIFIGVTDVPLSDSGLAQATQAGLKIKEQLIPEAAITVLYSPMERCRETAERIFGQLKSSKAKILPQPLLMERNYGAWEGMTRTAIKFHYPELYDQYEQGSLNCTPEGADPLEDVKNRTDLLRTFLNGQTDENIILVTHKTTGRILISSLLDLPLEKYREITFTNGQVIMLEACENQFSKIEV